MKREIKYCSESITKNLVFGLLVLLLANKITAQVESETDSISTNDNLNGLEISGLIIDKTQSKIGKEFYELFFTQWMPPKVNFDFDILLEEKTSPGFGTQISITINDLLIFQQLVQPRYEKIEEMVLLALQVSASHLLYYEEVQAEIENEDLDGTGIY